MSSAAALFGGASQPDAVQPRAGAKAPDADFVATFVDALTKVDEVAAKGPGMAGEPTPEVTEWLGDANDTETEAAAVLWGTSPEVPVLRRAGGEGLTLPTGIDEGLDGVNVEADGVTGTTAAAASSAATEASSDIEVSRTDRSEDRLDPALQAKLDRVMRRMESEHGHKVELVEGYRTAERQEHLFEQGRTRPGPVVTWTKDSAHMDGRAADLIVDGSYDDPVAYARLQQIAREEGLRTLGMNDRGHVELPAQDAARPSAFELRAERSGYPGAAVPRSGMARVARVASVANVARVASVARPGNAPRPPVIDIPAAPAPLQGPQIDLAPIDLDGPEIRPHQLIPPGGHPSDRVASAAGASTAPRLATPTPIAEPTSPLETAGTRTESAKLDGATEVSPAAESVRPAERAESRTAGPNTPSAATPTASDMESFGGSSSERDSDPKGESRSDRRAAEAVSPDRSSEARAAALDILSRATDGSIKSVQSVGRTDFSDALSRVERVLELQQAARAAEPGSVRVKLDGTAGPIESIRVGLTGNAVSAGLDVSDPEVAAMLRSRVDELTEALTMRGMELGAVGINGSQAPDALIESLLGARTDPTTELLRTLLGGSSADGGRDERDNERRQQAFDSNRSQDDRPGTRRDGRDEAKEHQR